MATARLLRVSKPVRHVRPPGTTSSGFTTVSCKGGASTSGSSGDHKIVFGHHTDERQSRVAVKGSAATSSERLIITKPLVDGMGLLTLLSAVVRNSFLKLRPALRPKTWRLQVQMLIEKAVIDCRFFTLFAVAGSLLGSVLCFLEGCLLVLQSYLQYLSSLSRISDQGRIIHQLIEAMDMFLVGTAMFIFGVGLHVMFVGTKESKDKEPWLPGSNLFGLFSMKSLPKWVEMESVSQAKSKIGQAVMMILQVGLLENFRSIPLVTGLDLACFAGAIFTSSACIFLLSRLSLGGMVEERGS